MNNIEFARKQIGKYLYTGIGENCGKIVSYEYDEEYGWLVCTTDGQRWEIDRIRDKTRPDRVTVTRFRILKFLRW
jgi:hypothetical protein